MSDDRERPARRTTREALELLAETSEQLADIARSTKRGELKQRLAEMARGIDRFLIGIAVESGGGDVDENPATATDAGSEPALQRAAELIHSAKSLLIIVGEAASADSGLAPFSLTGQRVPDLSESHRQAALAAAPHAGFRALLELTRGKRYFVVTSAVDGLLVRSGFDLARILELHGSLLKLSCSARCGYIEDPGGALMLEGDPATVRPCPRCGAGLRHGVELDDTDSGFERELVLNQELAFCGWCDKVKGPMVVLEVGASGTLGSEILSSFDMDSRDAVLVRVNALPADAPLKDGDVVIEGNVADALVALRGAIAKIE